MEHQPPARRARINEDPLSLLHLDVFELIFQHFSGKDVLNSSEVSHSWFKTIEPSAKCGEKIRLKLSDTNDLRELSQRKCRNIILQQVSISSNVLSIMKDRNWKNVIITSVQFSNRKELYDLLDTIEETVEVLHIENSTISGLLSPNQEENRKFKFPRLSELRLVHRREVSDFHVFEDCTSLKTLLFEIYGYRKKTLGRILRNNQMLEYLVVRNCISDSFGREPVENFQFKLKRFEMTGCPESYVKVTGFLFSFLQGQANFLETLKLDRQLNVETIKLILEMPKISELHFHSLEQGHVGGNLRLPRSLTLTKVCIQGSYRNLNFLLDATPNLKFLHLNFLNDDALALIAPRCSSLQELDVSKFCATRIDNPSFFPNLRRVEIRQIQLNLEENVQHIEAKSPDERTSFEQEVLEGAVRAISRIASNSTQ